MLTVVRNATSQHAPHVGEVERDPERHRGRLAEGAELRIPKGARERDRPPRLCVRHEVAGADVLVDLSAEEADVLRVRLRPERREVLDGLGDDVEAVAPVAKEDGDVPVAEVVDDDAGAAAGVWAGRSVRGRGRVRGGGAR